MNRLPKSALFLCTYFLAGLVIPKEVLQYKRTLENRLSWKGEERSVRAEIAAIAGVHYGYLSISMEVI